MTKDELKEKILAYDLKYGLYPESRLEGFGLYCWINDLNEDDETLTVKWDDELEKRGFCD